jgi:hypothetical protein
MQLDATTLDHLHKLLLRRTQLDPLTNCWVWVGAWSIHGYGMVTFRRKHYSAHRVAAAAYLGFDLESKLDVFHAECNTRACCNPDHLRVGTRAEQVAHFRQMYRDGWTLAERRRVRKEARPCA